MLALTPAEAIYRALYRRRKAKFARGGVDVGVPVVSVGNITVGGTGKTPTVQWVARELLKSGSRVAIVSRGYGGALSASGAVVSNGAKLLLSAREAGDEPLLHARTLPGVPVLIGVDRVAAARRAVEECGAEIIVLDDAFQFWSLKRDFDLLLLDARRPFDNGHLLPAGRLREPPGELHRASAILLTRCAAATPRQIADARRKIADFSQAPIFESNHAAAGVRDEATGEVWPLSKLSEVSVGALSALAHNTSFFETLTGCGAQIEMRLARRDHHFWREDEVRNFARQAKQNGVRALVTTEKDAVKMQAAWTAPLPLWSLPIRLDLGDDAERLRELMWKVLAQKPESFVT